MLWGERRGIGTIVAATDGWSAPMRQPNDLSRSLVALDQDSTLIAVIEMGQASWLVAGIVPGVNRHPLKKIATAQEQLLQSAPALGEGGRDNWANDQANCRCLRGRSRWFLVGALAPRTRGRGLCHSSVECPGLTRAPAGEDRSPGHRVAQARLSRLAAGRARSLHYGGDPDADGGGREATRPRAGKSRRRAHSHHQPDQGSIGAPWHPRVQADVA